MIKDFQKLKNELSNMGGGGGGFDYHHYLCLVFHETPDLDLEQECLEVEVVS